ncbi:MAG: class I SAM-dependent methyltransferase [Candidatus Kerfeldbacteria bacterium]|nr:class I SAM-dependent methyltransferase [Candidatus Kerfeldbacteria bacterium]
MGADLLFYGIVIVVILVFATAAIAGVKAAPYVPTFQRDVRRMLRVAEVKPGELVVDLGAGDGRFLITAVREFGARAVGYELSLLPYLVAKLRVRLAGLGRQIQIFYRDFYQVDLSPADVVTCFLTPRAMTKLEPKFTAELNSGRRVVSYAFKLPTIEPLSVDKPHPRATPIFLYRFG